MVDTCAAEFDAATPYYYSTYDQENEALPLEGPKALVIGSGPIRIGQGIEFVYCSVHAARALSQAGVKSIMVNSNPETVSTDFDASDRLYFEPLDEESVRDILDNEAIDGQPPPSVVQFGGQTAIDLSQSLAMAGPYVVTPLTEVLRGERASLPAGTTVVVVTSILTRAMATEIAYIRDNGYQIRVLYTGDQAPSVELPGVPVVRLGRILETQVDYEPAMA